MRIDSMAALGSSFAAGPGLAPFEDRRAGRSRRNYAHLAAQRLGARLTDLTISGATTDTVLTRSQRTLGRSYPPQLDGLPDGVDLVTVTAGGNDIGYVGTVTRSGWAAAVSRATRARLSPRVRPPRSGGAEAVAQGLVDIVDAVRERCPGATVVLVDYLPLVPRPGTSSRVLWLPRDLPMLHRLADQVADGFAQAADACQVPLLSCSQFGRGHEAGTIEPWVRSAAFKERGLHGAACHPTASGMDAVATALVDLVQRL